MNQIINLPVWYAYLASHLHLSVLLFFEHLKSTAYKIYQSYCVIFTVFAQEPAQEHSRQILDFKQPSNI